MIDEIPDPLRIDNSKRSTAVTCLRKYYYEYVRNLAPKTGSVSLRYGSAWHEAMDAYYSCIAKFGWDNGGKALELAIKAASLEWAESSKDLEFFDDYRTLPNLMKGLIHYIERFSSDSQTMKIIAAETPYAIEMEADESLGLHIPFIFTGMIDLEVELSGMNWIIDHKTTGQPLTKQIARLNRQPQFIGYSWAAKQWLAEPPDGFLIQVHHISAYKSKKTFEWGEPKLEYGRSPQCYSVEDMEQWKDSLYETVSRIVNCHNYNKWPMTFDSCYNYGECSFASLCNQHRPLREEFLLNFMEREHWDVVANAEKGKQRRLEVLGI